MTSEFPSYNLDVVEVTVDVRLLRLRVRSRASCFDNLIGLRVLSLPWTRSKAVVAAVVEEVGASNSIDCFGSQMTDGRVDEAITSTYGRPINAV